MSLDHLVADDGVLRSDAMELTPETFEKAEFIERRRGGYDIDQVETFLEETGTEFARMLVRFERTEADLRSELAAAEERTRDLESQVTDLRQKLALTADRLIDTEQRLEAETAARSAQASAVESAGAVESQPASEDDVANVAKALILAQEAADKTLREARAEARGIVDGANARSERQLAETTTKVAALINEAKARADREYASRREAVLEEVTELADRRELLAESISRMEVRITGYREDLRRAGEELISVAEDPSFLGETDPTIELVEDPAAADEPERRGPKVDPEADPAESVRTDAAEESDEDPASDTVEDDTEDRSPTSEESDPEPVAATEDTVVSEDDDQGDDESEENVSVQDALEFEADEDDADTDAAADAAEPADGQLEREPELGKGWFDADPTPSKSTRTAEAPEASDETDEPDDLLDLRSPESRAADKDEAGGEWGPGSWSVIEKSLRSSEGGPDADQKDPGEAAPIAAKASTVSNPAVDVDRVESSRDQDDTEAIDRVELIRDRYLEELDQAVNTELDAEDEALAAFLEGSGNSKARRFGWRR